MTASVIMLQTKRIPPVRFATLGLFANFIRSGKGLYATNLPPAAGKHSCDVWIAVSCLALKTCKIEL